MRAPSPLKLTQWSLRWIRAITRETISCRPLRFWTLKQQECRRIRMTGERKLLILLRDGNVVDRFQSLMNAGRHILSDVVNLTGITDRHDRIGAAGVEGKVKQLCSLEKIQSWLTTLASTEGFGRLSLHSWGCPQVSPLHVRCSRQGVSTRTLKVTGYQASRRCSDCPRPGVRTGRSSTLR
jgi:hypothetical protein